jgi:hypothetical protein
MLPKQQAAGMHSLFMSPKVKSCDKEEIGLVFMQL